MSLYIRRWAPFIVLASLLAAGCAHAPSAPPAGHGAASWATPHGVGWDDTDQDDDLQPAERFS